VVSLKAGENCKSKQTVCFDSKPILLWLQRNAEVTENFVSCLQLSKLKLGLELKQKFHSETTISEQFQPNPANVKMDILSQLWNLRSWYSLVASVQGFCFNSQF